MKKLLLIVLTFITVSCSKRDPVETIETSGQVSLILNGDKIHFKEVSLERVTLDFDQGSGIMAYCKTKVSEDRSYIAMIDFKPYGNGYRMHKINLNIMRRIGESISRLENYYAFLIDEINATNFAHSSTTKGDRLTGNFSGSMSAADPSAGQILVSGGAFNLKLSTLR